MKIAYLITRLDSIGGAQIHVRDMSLRAKKDGHDVLVLGGGSGQLVKFLKKNDIRVISLDSLIRKIHPIKDLKSLYEIKKYLYQERPDILSCHSSKAGILGRLATRKIGIPTIFTAHGWAFSDGVPNIKRKLYILIERYSASLAKKIITVSKYDYQLALKYKVVTSEKMICIHNGMPDTQIQSMLQKDKIRICMIARFDQPKDQVGLLQALFGLKNYEWEVDFLGDGPKLYAVGEKAKELKISDRVHFYGYQPEVDRFLERASIFCLISNWEGFPRSILEAMRSNLPVIASDVGGISESVQDGITGYLVPRGNILVLRECLQKLMNSSKIRKEMGNAGRKRYEKYFTFEKMAEKTLSVYNEIINK